MSERNTYNPDTPEWQLCENMISARGAAAAFAADAERFQRKAQEQRDKAERFQAALERLTKDTTP